jgi:two-component system cell cycle sensor histidine kinase/response regulator CckA
VVEAHNTPQDLLEGHTDHDVAPGDFVALSISDTGTGIAPELLTRIYDPFFSTRPIGIGTGLGLSICYGVVKQARGFITVQTAVGHGTTFRVHLPRCHSEVVDIASSGAMPQTSGPATILLVEDQEGVRSLLVRALRRYGYHVFSAPDAQQALALHRGMTERLDLLVTDVAMPHTNGLELASALQARVPRLPVLYLTGYFDARNPAFESLTPDQVLLKPFTPMQLAQRVESALAEARQRGSM